MPLFPCLPEHVVIKLVVAGQGDEAALAGAEREENLDGGVAPYLQRVRYLQVLADPTHRLLLKRTVCRRFCGRDK